MSVELALILAVLLLFGNAFFVAAEFALVSVRRSAIELRVLDGSRSAVATLRAMENASLLLAGSQLGITICSLGLGAVGEPAIAYLLEGPFHSLHVPEHLLHPLSFAIALSVMVFLHVVIGEVVPKNISISQPERAALRLIPMLLFVVKILGPIVKMLNAMANLSLRLVGIQPKNEVNSTYTRDEVADLVAESHREGFLSEDEEQLLSDALVFDQRTIKSVYIPLDTVVSIKRSMPLERIEQLAASSGFSRFPIMDKGKFIGYIHLKDVLRVNVSNRSKPIHRDNIRPLVSVASNKTLWIVLKTMQHSGAHVICVVNSKKECIGIATLEDVLGELIGDLNTQVVKV